MTAYLTFKTLHIIAIISWMAGLLYLFRLFVYHCERGESEEIHQLLSLMEKRLYRYITFPAMLAAVVAGTMMVSLNPYLLAQPWFLIKAGCGLLMVVITFFGGSLQQRFQFRKAGGFTSKKLRILNEVPTLLMILIVVMVVFRPF